MLNTRGYIQSTDRVLLRDVRAIIPATIPSGKYKGCGVCPNSYRQIPHEQPGWETAPDLI